MPRGSPNRVLVSTPPLDTSEEADEDEQPAQPLPLAHQDKPAKRKTEEGEVSEDVEDSTPSSDPTRPRDAETPQRAPEAARSGNPNYRESPKSLTTSSPSTTTATSSFLNSPLPAATSRPLSIPSWPPAPVPLGAFSYNNTSAAQNSTALLPFAIQAPAHPSLPTTLALPPSDLRPSPAGIMGSLLDKSPFSQRKDSDPFDISGLLLPNSTSVVGLAAPTATKNSSAKTFAPVNTTTAIRPHAPSSVPAVVGENESPPASDSTTGHEEPKEVKDSPKSRVISDGGIVGISIATLAVLVGILFLLSRVYRKSQAKRQNNFIWEHHQGSARKNTPDRFALNISSSIGSSITLAENDEKITGSMNSRAMSPDEILESHGNTTGYGGAPGVHKLDDKFAPTNKPTVPVLLASIQQVGAESEQYPSLSSVAPAYSASCTVLSLRDEIRETEPPPLLPLNPPPKIHGKSANSPGVTYKAHLPTRLSFNPPPKPPTSLKPLDVDYTIQESNVESQEVTPAAPDPKPIINSLRSYVKTNQE